MPDLLRIIASWWKKIAVLAVAAVAFTILLLLLKPPLYLSVVTALPANSATLDKAKIFNPNIEQLYPAFGTPDELEKFLSVAELGSIYGQLIAENNLLEHYNMDGDDKVHKAIEKLRTRITVTRTKWNDLKIRAWDKDPQMAARLANAFLAKAEALHQKLQQQNERLVLQKLQQELSHKEKQFGEAYVPNDSAVTNIRLTDLKRKALEQNIVQLQELVTQYSLSVQTPLPLLLIAEEATPSFKPDKPKIFQTALVVLIASLLFGVLAVIFIESRKIDEQQA